MPLFSWMRWSHDTRVKAPAETESLKSSRDVPSCMLIQELLWQVEEREQLAREREWEHRLTHWCQYPRLQSLISTSELHQLEFLCSQIPPTHAASVLSRFREILATNNIRPWELSSIFKLVLRDYLRQKQFAEEDNPSVQPRQLLSMEAWTSRYKMKQGFVTTTVPTGRDPSREEIPTISGYVDGVMQHSSLVAANRDWDLPYYYPATLRPKGAYSTTL